MPNELLHTIQPPAHIEQCGDGPTVLLLHGWGISSELLQPTMAGLKHAFRLIAPDFPGFGGTPAQASVWSIHDYTAWLVALFDQLKIERAHVVGHSFGGRVAICLASQHPERVAKLVLTDSAGIRPKRTFNYWIQVRTFKTLRWLYRLSEKWPLPAPLRRRLEARIVQSGSPDYQKTAGVVRGSFVKVVNEDLRHLLPRIQAPTLLIWGDKDEDVPLADGQLMEKLIPDAGLVVLQGAGHYAYLEQSAYFCRIVETFFKS